MNAARPHRRSSSPITPVTHSLVVALVAAITSLGAGQADGQTQYCNGYLSGVSAANASRGWTATWVDEFDAFDTSRWSKAETVQNNGSPGINVPSKVWVRDGKLHIGSSWDQPRGIYLSGFVTTKPSPGTLSAIADTHPLYSLREGGSQFASHGFSFKHGRIEFCAKAATYVNPSGSPSTAGTHMSLWLMPTDGTWPPELDVMENYSDVGTIAQHVHYGGWDNHQYPGVWTYLTTTEYVEQYHLYALEWSDTELRYFVNDTLTRVMTPTDGDVMVNGGAFAELNGKSGFYIIMDTQIQEYNKSALQTPVGSTAMLIDWVKVYYDADSAGLAACAPRARLWDARCSPSVQAGTDIIVDFDVPDPHGDEWLALYKIGEEGYRSWIYSDTCDHRLGKRRGSGSCPFSLPDEMGAWVVKMHRHSTVLGTSGTITATAAVTPDASIPTPSESESR